MRKEAIESTLARTFGQKPEVREEIAKINNKATDWYGFCRKCGKRREGTLDELRAPCGCSK